LPPLRPASSACAPLRWVLLLTRFSGAGGERGPAISHCFYNALHLPPTTPKLHFAGGTVNLWISTAEIPCKRYLRKFKFVLLHYAISSEVPGHCELPCSPLCGSLLPAVRLLLFQRVFQTWGRLWTSRSCNDFRTLFRYSDQYCPP
jgi:hypothetical protein